ncbi:MAG: UvrB/UvrC motif-containing protein [Bacillota bacterium]
MLCEKCGKQPATVHYTEITNNKKQEMHLCEECAREAGIAGFGVLPQLVLHDFLGGLFDKQPELHAAQVSRRCSRCGLTEQEFAGRGLLGCGDCYTEFRSAVEQMLRRIHGTVQHSGKFPRRAGKVTGLKQELNRLRRELDAAVRKEEFEKAAGLRDRIRELEKGLGGR